MCGPRRVLVTGAAGNVGREVVRSLAPSPMAVRAADDSIDEIVHQEGFPIDRVRLSLDDPSTFAPALEGCDAMLLVPPGGMADSRESLNTLIDAAVAARVGHIVLLSIMGAAENEAVPQHDVERYVAEAKCGHTVLRPAFFAQNLGGAYRQDITDGRLFLPASRARVAMVDVRDVAEVAALVLASPLDHAGKEYTLTGPSALSFDEVAEILTRVLGRKITYEPASVVDYVRHLHERGVPLGRIAVETVLHVGLRNGQAEDADVTLETLLGRAARSVERYVLDHETLWRRNGRGPSA